MNDSKHPQGICEFMDEDALITGGKSVSEIIQMLRTNEKVKKIVKGCDDNEDREEQSRKVSFPWMLQFGASCKDVISNPSIGKLDKLMSIFLKNIEKDVKQCSKKPKRAYRLRLRMNPFIILFHMIYWEIKKPLEHTSYLEKMSDIMALFIDVELKSSRIARENPKKISQRICSSLYVLLDKSTDHILDSVLKSTFFNKNYHEICVPIIERLLKDHPGKLDEATYVRYLLSFKLWKKLAGRDQYVNINKEASVKLKPPPNLAESLKSSRLSNVLPFPYLSKKESLTNFFMRSPFDVKEKAKLFLKDGRKFQPSSDFEKAFLFDEVNCFDKDLEMDQSNTMDDIFNSLVDKEIDPLHELLDSESLDEEDDILINLKTSKSKNKLKRTVTDKVSSSLGKMALKKRKLSKPNVCVPIKNVSTKEPYGIVTPEMKHLIIPVTAKEENAIVFSVDESLKKEEKTNLSLTNSPEVLQKKPCATVEPEQCKEVEADSQSKSEGILSKHNMKSPVNSFETSKERAAVHDKPIKEISDSSKSLQSYEIIDITSPINETDIEETLSDLVDSTESCEEVKIETEPNTQGIFVVHQIYKDSKEYEEPLLEVAEEVIIDTEVSQDDGLLIMEGEHQVKLNPNEIMNVIGVPKDSRPFCPDSEDISSETWKKCQEQKEISLLRNELNSLCNESKFNFAKDQSSGLTNSQQLLSPYNNNGECLLDLIQDSYAYNEIKMTSLLSVEINGDDESDDDHRHPNKQFAKGGKFPAFRAQTDESKSDGGEESEAPSPASQTDSNTVEVSPQSTNSQVANSSPAHVNLQDSTQEKKYELKGDILPLPTPTKQTKPSLVSPLQLPEVSVSLSYMTDLGNLNDYHLNTDKNNTKGMCEPPDIILHFKTVIDHLKFFVFQQELYYLYITTENILETDPVPYPTTKLVSPPINGHDRCPCPYCVNIFLNLDRNYNTLFSMRSNRICQEIDKKRVLSKMYLDVEKTKMENEKLLKSIEETMPVTNVHLTATDCPKDLIQTSKSGEKPLTMEDEKLISNKEDNSPDSNIINPIEENFEDKSDYSSLPLKKRKAFSGHSEQIRPEGSDFENTEINKECKIKIYKGNSAICSTNKCEQPMSCNFTSFKQIETSIEVTEGCSIAKNEQSAKPSLVENSCSEKSENLHSEIGNDDIPQIDIKPRHEKCHKHHKRSKEERRLRKERKRLKKLKKEQE